MAVNRKGSDVTRRIRPLQPAISALFVVIALLAALALGSAAWRGTDLAGAKPPDIDICPVCVPDDPPPAPPGWL